MHPHTAPAAQKATITAAPAANTASAALAAFDALPDTAFARESQIVSKPGRPGIVPVASSTWWRWVKSGKAPQPVKLGEKVTAWRVGELRAWMQSRAAA